jgi:hypothetical protein
VTAREAVKRARSRMLHMEQSDGEMIAVLVDHIGQLERAIALADAGHQSFMRHVPSETAVHEINGPVSMNIKPPSPRRKR